MSTHGTLHAGCRTVAELARGTWRRLRLVLATGAWVGLTACAYGLPPLPERQPSTHLSAAADSPLAKAYHPPLGNTALTGVTLLSDPTQALATRVLLARAAQRGLDVQVYIWRPDASGQILLHELWRAAQRGVRVRLLLDDNGSTGMDTWLQALAAQPGVEVRLFNPFVQREFKALGYLTDFARLNQRMHDKSFTADSLATIVGGRNVGDVYFGGDAALLFSDLDLLALGPAAQATARQFDAYWNSPLAYPLAALVPAADPAELARHRQQLTESGSPREAERLQASLQAAAWLTSPQTSPQTSPPTATPPMHWAPVQLWSDSPDKIDNSRHDTAPGQRVFQALSAWLRTSRRTLDLVSPYFVPGDAGVQGLIDLARQGVAVRVITNSLAATDVMAVHAGYARHRQALLAAGVQVYELKPDAHASARRPTLPWRLRLGPSSAASLHGKTFVVDQRHVFVGSFNLDPRSAYLNAEMGLTADSEALARTLTEGLDRDLAATTYRLTLAADGALQWIETGASGEQVHVSEPKASLLRRMGARVLSWLPIEGLL
jgi:putative cardiolipin synthase